MIMLLKSLSKSTRVARHAFSPVAVSCMKNSRVAKQQYFFVRYASSTGEDPASKTKDNVLKVEEVETVVNRVVEKVVEEPVKSAKPQKNEPIEETQPRVPFKMITSNVVEETKLHPTLKTAFVTNIGPTLTPVQEECINEFVSSEKGIVVRAKTGTGKTFAFGLPILHDVLESQEEALSKIDPKLKKSITITDAEKYVNSVIFAPTRDLAFQIQQALETLWSQCLNKKFKEKYALGTKRDKRGQSSKSFIPLVIGQTPYRQTMKYFTSRFVPPVVVATPGRFMDMLENEPKFRASFKHLKNIVIDEADEMLNGNFKEDINSIIDSLHSIREPIPHVETEAKMPKTMLFSATVNQDVFDLAEKAIGHEFPFIDVTGAKTSEVNERITQTLVQTENLFDCYAAAVKYISEHAADKSFKAIVFLPTTSAVDFVSRLLGDTLRSGGSRRRVYAFHGKLRQEKRDRVQSMFRSQDNSVLVASGIAGRGMDFPNVSHVIQIGVSSEINSHTHKIGRTGRAGKTGEALLFTTKTEEPFVKALEKNGNKFSNVETYEPDETVESEIVAHTSKYDDLEEIILKSLSHYKNIPPRVARMNMTSLGKDVSELYEKMSGSPGTLPTLSYSMAEKLGMDVDALEESFEFTGHRSFKRRKNDNGRRNKGGNRWNNDGERSNYGGGERRNSYGGNERRNSYSGSERRNTYGGGERRSSYEGGYKRSGSSDNKGGYRKNRSEEGNGDDKW